MTVSFGWGMLLYGLVCIFIGAIIVYLVINRKTPEQKSRNHSQNRKNIPTKQKMKIASSENELWETQ